MRKSVAIVGAGTAGIASAIFLSRQGFSVTLFEKIAQAGAVGAGILLQPTGLSVLAELGLHTEILQRGARINHLDGRTRNGRPVINLSYAELHTACHGLGVHRASLLHVLQQGMQQEDINLQVGVDVKTYQQHGDSVELHVEGNLSLGRFDLLLVTNGAKSTLRNFSEQLRLDKPYPWGALWAIVEQPAELRGDCLQQVYHTAQYMAGLLPTGSLPGQEEQLTSLFWSIPTSHHAQWRDGSVDFSAWKEMLAKLWPKSECVLDKLHSHEQLAFANYRDVVMQQWAEGRVVFMGDAAHSMSPQLGQGANLALCDASVLHHCLSTVNDVEQALKNYNTQRLGHIKFYQNMSRLLTPFYQSNNLAYAWLRDGLSWPLTQVPWVRQQMLETLCGIKTGALSQFDICELLDSCTDKASLLLTTQER
jgi:2-polyprenyl-6-methoxyphenol hydroxylase-like FAD-dependent oxidoreductase